jgi:hypothetical protein
MSRRETAIFRVPITTLEQDPAVFLASEVVRTFFYITVRLGAHVPRAAVVTADLKNNRKNSRRPAWISYCSSYHMQHRRSFMWAAVETYE